MKSILPLILFAMAAAAEPVALTDTQGRTMTAEITAKDAETVSVLRDGKPFRIKLDLLDENSRRIVDEFKMPAAAPGKTEVRLSGRTVSSGRSADKKWKTSWGSYDKDVYRSKTVQADVEVTAGNADLNIVVQWIGCPAGQPSDKNIVLSEKVPFKAKPGLRGTEIFDAVFVESDSKYAALGIRDRDGSKYTGWILRVVTNDGTIISQQASNPVYLSSFPKVDLAEASERAAEAP